MGLKKVEWVNEWLNEWSGMKNKEVGFYKCISKWDAVMFSET